MVHLVAAVTRDVELVPDVLLHVVGGADQRDALTVAERRLEGELLIAVHLNRRSRLPAPTETAAQDRMAAAR